MSTSINWQSDDEQVQKNQCRAYDDMRARCPVAHDGKLGYSVFSHADVMHILNDPATFSNHVSDRHIAVPNGIDAPIHTAFRAINDKYFTADRMARFRPIAKELIDNLVSQLPKGQPIDIMAEFAKTYAVKLQNAFMGWGDETEAPLNAWIEKNRKATLSQNRDEIASVALEFDGYIKAILDDKRTKRPDDVTFELMSDVVMLPQGKRVMSDEELVSLIRNWTVGELSTMSSAVGIIFEFFIHYPDVLIHLKANPQDIDNAVLEILRLHDPLITNRRRTTCPVTLHGIDIPKDVKITINWQSANRDPKAFHQADSFELHRSQANNLVYGHGIHVCPGKPLAQLELGLLVECLAEQVSKIRPASDDYFDHAIYPASGFSRLEVILH